MKQQNSFSKFIISCFCFKSCTSENIQNLDAHEADYNPNENPKDLIKLSSPDIGNSSLDLNFRMGSKFSLYLHPDQPESDVPSFPGCPKIKPSYRPAELPVYTTEIIQLTEQKLGKLVYPTSESIENSEKIVKGPTMMENRAIYIGEWNSSGEKHGRGIQIWPDGSKYEGEWLNNKTNKYGRLIHADGDVYEGNWLNDKASGHGIYIHSNGTKYEGNWLEDQQHGQGKEIWPDGAQYEGSYSLGSKRGQGKFIWADGSSYIGEFINNDIHGIGTYFWKDGRKYVGDWKFNKMSGKGEFFWPDGRHYKGEWMDGQQHGQGDYTWFDKKKKVIKVFKGSWNMGKRDQGSISTIND